MRSVEVNLKERTYHILIKSGLLSEVGSHIEDILDTETIVILTDENVADLYLGVLKEALFGITKDPFVIVLPPGEEQKSLPTISTIYDTILEKGCGRDSAILAFGGGVVGDISGFVASTYMRGIAYIQIPTSLLEQIDSSVGGKTGINHRLGKNLIGTFYQPKGAFIDPSLLRTLPERELRSGLIEVIKHGIIRSSRLFGFIEQNIVPIFDLSPDYIEELIEENCRIKASVVSSDEREKGVRTILNLGHTTGHALERITGYDEIHHGEAVGLGILMESYIALKMGHLTEREFNRIRNLLSKVISFSRFPEITPDELIDGMGWDKKRVKGKLRFVLPKGIGDTVITDDVAPDLIAECIRYLSKLKKSCLDS